MIWIMLATLAVVFVVGFRVLTSGARKAIRRLSDRLNIDVVPVESMVDQMGKSAGDEFLRYLHRPDESHLQNAAQVLLIWQIVIVDGSEQNLLQWHRILQKARLAAPITDAQVRLALGFLRETEPEMQDINAFQMRYNAFFQPAEGVHWLHWNRFVLSAYRPRLTCRVDKTFTPHPVIFALFRFDLNSSSSNTVKVAKTLNASHISMLKWSAFPLKHATGNTMSEFIAENRGADAITRPNWSAVFSVAFCVACLIIVEFLPVSLLTPMAQDLGISEGVAGQSVTVTAFVAMFASLFITQTIQATDRRYVVILFAVLLTLSCLLVSFANSFSLLLIGRACLGLALGGFWAMSASLTMRLVPPRTVPKALSVIFGAVSIALVIAAPLGSFLGELIGWRNVFNAAAVMGVLCIFWIIKSLPSLPGEPSHQKQNTFRLLQRPGVMAGMIAIFMSFAGQFAFFTYIRPVYMNLAGFGVDGLTLVLLSFGIASFIGTSLSSFILKRSVKLALAGAPLILAVSALVLTLWGSDKIVATGVAIIWGLTFALVPVGWSTWITRSLADQAEKAGSIQVAVIQLANTCGAAIGGYALDNIGLTSPLMLSGTLMLLTALLVTAKVKMKKS